MFEAETSATSSPPRGDEKRLLEEAAQRKIKAIAEKSQRDDSES